MRRRALISVSGAVVLVVAFLIFSKPDETISLIAIPQGMSVHESNRGRVFVHREGSVLYAVSAKTGQGFPVQWCPREQMLWSPKTLALWDRYGNQVRKGTQPRDALSRRRTSTNPDLQVTIEPGRPTETPPRAPVDQRVMRFYDDWLNRANLPTTRELIWCPEPLT